MRTLPTCLLIASLCILGCKDSADPKPTSSSGDSKPAAETKCDPKEILAALQQLGAAFYKFEGTHHTLPAAVILSKDGKPLLSWRVAILPYLNEESLYKQFKLDERWDSEHNKKLLAQMPKIFAPLRGPAPKEPHATYYQVFMGQAAPFNFWSTVGPKVTDFPDGTSQTFMIVEAGEAVPWTKPVDLFYDAGKPLPKLGFEDRFFVVLADGSAHFIKNTVPELVVRAAITPNGEERDCLYTDARSMVNDGEK